MTGPAPAPPETRTSPTTAGFEIRAILRGGDEPPPGFPGEDDNPGTRTVQRVTVTYAVPGAADALAAFAAGHPDICAPGSGWHLRCVIPGHGNPPARQLMNWERNPLAEAADGLLSNLAAQAASLAARLDWEPEFCSTARRIIPCPSCGGTLQTRTGRYESFYECPCGWKTGTGTRKGRAARAGSRITGWCGTRLALRYSDLGVPYPGCPACDPGYKDPAASKIIDGR